MIAHWWHDSSPASPRQEVLIRRDPDTGRYQVEHRAGSKSTTRDYDTEAEARFIADALRAGIVGWRNLTHD